MKLEVKELRNAPGLEEDFQYSEQWQHLETGQGTVKFISPVSFEGKVTNLGDSILAKGVVETELSLKCGRCLQNFNYQAKMEYLEEFVVSGSKEYEDCLEYDGEVIDFGPSLEENLILSLPMKWLCRQDCLGICSHCGQDLNLSQCDCKEEVIDLRMEALKKFLD